jgi:hypothetical protein
LGIVARCFPFTITHPWVNLLLKQACDKLGVASERRIVQGRSPLKVRPLYRCTGVEQDAGNFQVTLVERQQEWRVLVDIVNNAIEVRAAADQKANKRGIVARDSLAQGRVAAVAVPLIDVGTVVNQQAR